MTDLGAWSRAFARLPGGAAEAEVNAEERRLAAVELAAGGLVAADKSESLALFLRVSGERTGYLYTQDPEDDAAEALRQAYENGLCSGRAAPDEMRRGGMAVAADLGRRGAESDLGRLAEAASAFARAIRDAVPELPEPRMSLRAETLGLRTVNTHGLDVGFERPLYIMSAAASVERKGRRYAAGYNRTAADLEGFSARDFAENLLELLECQYDPEPFRPGRYRTVLRRNVAYNILSTAWQLFSGQRYLDGSSLLSGRLGETIASPLLSVRDRPALPGSGFDLPCDCEGSVGAPAELLEKGRFVGLMHNLATAKALGAEPTGNAGRRPLLSGSVPTAIQVTPRNVSVEPGSASLGELIEGLGDGLLVTGSFDVFHSIDIASGAFSIPCRGAVVRDGKKAAATGPLVLSGSLGELLAGVEEVGSDLYLGTMLALDNYGIGACSLRVGELSVSGT